MPYQHNLYGVPDKFKPTRDRRVKVRGIACPDCKAPVGSACTNADGSQRQGTVHASRRRMAIRAGL